MKGNPYKMGSHSTKKTMAYMKSPLEQAKPDYPDIDGDGNTTESMKQAAADKKSSPAKLKSPAKDKMSSSMVGEKTAKIHNKDYANNPDHNKNMHAKGRNTSIADSEKKSPAKKKTDPKKSKTDRMIEMEKNMDYSKWEGSDAQKAAKGRTSIQEHQLSLKQLAKMKKKSPAKKYKSDAQRKAVHASKADK